MNANCYLQLTPAGTPPLMPINGSYSQMPPPWRKSIAMSDWPLPGGKIKLWVALRIIPPRLIYFNLVPKLLIC
jgi:hypothetical protein